MKTRRARAVKTAQIVYRKAAPIVKRGATAAAKHAIEEKHTIAAIVAAAALGYAEHSGIAIPNLPLLGKAGTLGVAAFALAKATNNRTARHVATGLLAVAAYELGKQGRIEG